SDVFLFVNDQLMEARTSRRSPSAVASFNPVSLRSGVSRIGVTDSSATMNFPHPFLLTTGRFPEEEAGFVRPTYWSTYWRRFPQGKASFALNAGNLDTATSRRTLGVLGTRDGRRQVLVQASDRRALFDGFDV